DSALGTAEATMRYALGTGHHLSLSNALAWAAPVFFWTGRHEECDRCTSMLTELVDRHGFDDRRPAAMFYRAAVACSRENATLGDVEDLGCAVAEFRATGNLGRLPFHLSVLAYFLARQGRLSAAETTIRSAVDRAEATNERWCL